MSYNANKRRASLDLTPIKAIKRNRCYSSSSASSGPDVSHHSLVKYGCLTDTLYAKSDDEVLYASTYSPTRTIIKHLGKKVEELERYISELEAKRDEHSIRDEEEHRKHADEVAMFEERIDDLQATVDFQNAKMDIMENEVERLEAENERMRMEKQAIIDDNIEEDRERVHAWHQVQENLLDYIKSIEV
jgi:chromosome segregation ATPase